MKHYKILLVFLICVASCIKAQDNNCSRITYFGEKEVCLPIIDGYNECYNHPTIKYIADNTEVAVNAVLGYYLNDENYEERDSLEGVLFDDYFKIYATKELSDYNADQEDLKQMKTMLAGNFIQKNWDEMKEDIADAGIQAQIDTPTVIKSYQLNDDSFTNLMVANYNIEGQEPYTMSIALNGILINEQFIWMAYYLIYTEEKTIEQLQINSDSILKAIQN